MQATLPSKGTGTGTDRILFSRIEKVALGTVQEMRPRPAECCQDRVERSYTTSKD